MSPRLVWHDIVRGTIEQTVDVTVLTDHAPRIVTGWAEEDAADTSLVQLTDGGSVEDRSETVEFLNQWAQEFIENRTRSS